MADQDFTLTCEYLHELFEYRNGMLFWKISPSYRIKAGDQVGCLNALGYWQTKIKGKKYFIHRLIFLMHHKVLPKFIDHINRNPADNRIENLRESTKSQNAMNTNLSRKNTTGFKNIYWVKARSQWEVALTINKKRIRIGFFDDFELSKIAAQEARNKYYGEFANSNM